MHGVALEHVSRDLVRDHRSWWHDRYQTGATPDLFWTAANGGHWIGTRAEDAVHFLGNPSLS